MSLLASDRLPAVAVTATAWPTKTEGTEAVERSAWNSQEADLVRQTAFWTCANGGAKILRGVAGGVSFRAETVNSDGGDADNAPTAVNLCSSNFGLQCYVS